MKSPLKHLLLAVGLVAITLTAWYIGYTSFIEKSHEVIALQSTIDATTETMNRLTAARAAIAEIVSDESRIKEYLVSEDKVASFINDLEVRALAQKAKATVVSVSTAGSKQRPTLLLALAISGSFDAIMRTIGSIEYAPYALSIGTLSIVREPETAGLWRADMNIVVSLMPASPVTQP